MANNENNINTNVTQQAKNTAQQEKGTTMRTYVTNVEQSVKECVIRIEKAIKNIDINNIDVDMQIVKNYSNPTKEEIHEQLNKLPSVMAYYNNLKVYSQLLLDLAEQDLFLAQVKAREEFKIHHEDKMRKYQADIDLKILTASNSQASDKAMMVVKELVKTLKPKEPTEKDVESYITSRTAKEQRDVTINRYRFNKIKEYCVALNNKYLAVRALRYSIEEGIGTDKLVSGTNTP